MHSRLSFHIHKEHHHDSHGSHDSSQHDHGHEDGDGHGDGDGDGDRDGNGGSSISSDSDRRSGGKGLLFVSVNNMDNGGSQAGGEAEGQCAADVPMVSPMGEGSDLAVRPLIKGDEGEREMAESSVFVPTPRECGTVWTVLILTPPSLSFSLSLSLSFYLSLSLSLYFSLSISLFRYHILLCIPVRCVPSATRQHST